MDTTLVKTKRLIIRKQYVFTEKAVIEMDKDSLAESDVLESIINAQFVRSKRSTSKYKKHRKEKVYITWVCT